MCAQLFVFATVCLATALANPLMGLESFGSGPEDIAAFLRINEQYESTYSSVMSNSLSDYGLLLNSQVIAAYNVSQSAGQCALAIERLTNQQLLEAKTSAWTSITNNTAQVENALHNAKTAEEIKAAIIQYATYAQNDAKILMDFLGEGVSIYMKGVVDIKKCFV